jgi:DNA-binding PadR family transcriptional regulator
MFGPKAMKGIFGRGPWRGFDPRRGRVFGKGDLKYVILDLLRDRPAHGYEVMRQLEGRFRGLYSPSPGSVYPTLQMLEDLGYVAATQQDGKKVYEITDEGRGFLEENRRSVENIWSRVGGGWDPEVAAGLHEMRHEMMGLGRLFGREMHEGRLDEEKLRRIREVVAHAAREIEGILDDRDPPGTTRV